MTTIASIRQEAAATGWDVETRRASVPVDEWVRLTNGPRSIDVFGAGARLYGRIVENGREVRQIDVASEIAGLLAAR